MPRCILLWFNWDIILNINWIIVAIVNFCSITNSTNIISEMYIHFICMLFRLRGSCLKIREGIFLSIVCWILESYAIAQVLRAEVIRDLALQCFQEKERPLKRHIFSTDILQICCAEFVMEIVYTTKLFDKIVICR